MSNLILTISAFLIYALFGFSFELRIKNGRPFDKDTYLCSSMEMPSYHTLYLTSFQKAWNTTNAHHMIIMSCNEPASQEPNWNCKAHTKDSLPACKDSENFIFSWAMDAPGFSLPADTSIKVGKGVPNTKYLVLQVHYKDATKFHENANLLDDSGMEIEAQTEPTKRSTGIILSVTGGIIPAKSLIYLDAMCQVDPSRPLQPIAYRVHAHRLCDLISIFRIRGGKWEPIGLQSPKKPQTFYPIKDSSMNIKQGDLIATRCVMNNTKNEENVKIGDNASDEMCNSYLMYSYPAENDPEMINVCPSNGFPEFSWNDYFDEDEIPIESKKNLDSGVIMEENYEDDNEFFEPSYLGF